MIVVSLITPAETFRFGAGRLGLASKTQELVSEGEPCELPLTPGG
jgi:prophage tail gpP-like protein